MLACGTLVGNERGDMRGNFDLGALVVAAGMSGEEFGAIDNAHFVQMNLFRPPFPDATFDLVISNGVLHHTSDPEGGFHAIARKLKPGGFVIIGLYNWLGRIPTLARRKLIEAFDDRWAMLDARLRTNALNAGRRSA